VLLSGLPGHDNSLAHQGASRTPQRRGVFALLSCSTNSALFGYGFPTGLTPPKIAAQHTIPTCILQQLTTSAWPVVRCKSFPDNLRLSGGGRHDRPRADP
jgi:hypothetical protein